MNKQSFLSSLAAKEWCGGLAGEPLLQEQKPDGAKWYIQNIRDESNGVGTYRNINFYVIDEGLETERVVVKDQGLISAILPPDTPFTDKVMPYIESSGNIILDEIHENSRIALIRFYGGGIDGVTEKRYVVNEDAQGNLRKIEII